jgi:fluoroacetyl-CoA thioesterase
MAPEAGEERSEEFFVSGDLLTDVGGTIGASVLSTPAMIGMMEHCSSILAYESLPEGSATVGFEVCVKHVAAALEGSTCVVRSALREVVEDRKLRFDVEVACVDPEAPEGERTVGLGTHERRIIATNQLSQPST